MATTTAPPHATRLDHHELRRFLNALRFQLWWRDALVLVAVSALIGALLGVALIGAWVAGACVAIGLIVAGVRRPTRVRAARVADRQLRTSSRLATAAEVLDGRLSGVLAPAQLDDAWRTASSLAAWRAYPGGWRRVQFATVALLASVALVGLTLAGVFAPVDVIQLLGGQPASLEDADSTSEPGIADQAITSDDLSKPASAQTMEDLQSQAAQSQAAQAALQKLADALRPTAAARDIGDSLRAGNYDDAMAKLDSLATQSDQLSRTAKRELGAAMERAAVDSSKIDPPLAVAEDRVARAISRNVYSETRSSLQDLSKAVNDAKNGVISQEALARELDQLQQQSQQPAAPGGGGGDIGESAEGYIPDIPGEQPNQVGLVQGVASTISVPGPEGDPNKSSRSSVGTEAGGDPFGDPSSRLDIAPADLSVDAQVGNDAGRTGLKASPQAPVVKISDSAQNGVTPSDVAQATDPVQAVAEQQVEPSEQRSAVRSFFKPASDQNTP